MQKCKKCKYCRHWNDFEHTYVDHFVIMYEPRNCTESLISFDCCSYYHEAYSWDDNYGEREKECCQPQLTLF